MCAPVEAIEPVQSEGNVGVRAIARVLVCGGVLGAGVLLASQGGGRGGVQVKPGEPCPPGTTEVRPGRCSAPEFPPPSIVDYRPRTTLVVPRHPVPRAKYPVVDSHNHTTVNASNIDQLVREMDELNLRVLVNLSGGSNPDSVKQKVDFIRASGHPDRFRVFANVAWNGAGGAGWAEKAVADLEQSIRNGAIGLKIAKDLGMFAKKADGSRLHVDDPALKPVWDLCARLNIPVIIHTAEPQEFFSPLDNQNERWLELALFRDRRHYAPGEPTFEELVGERDRMYAANPKTRYIGAHFNWYGNDLVRAGRQLDQLPNLVLELGAVLYDFGRQPRAAREFFIKYQDRILFGKDSYQFSEFPYYWRVFETADEYFDYYRDYHAFWKLYGMDLPDAVLKKIYYQNALRVTAGLPQSGWPR
jgi:predicted TIM-barrel fold metal-dependent hydrolase